ncbi:TATA element modulatory factor 1 TATA binding-domain-containing protein [Sphaerosporella brunnea]|uniref:TATA element modulatory factor 1 TATA binding-domain-containing protein n=1 Tax=Sphaerosporella brunnea TaxID=1250544 RepID=A0A5J5ENP9_9PEZI|nr:TATA element modulatory factor 1 TATA binding-domain-containing protein [Sphaerosporella brunnea]
MQRWHIFHGTTTPLASSRNATRHHPSKRDDDVRHICCHARSGEGTLAQQSRLVAPRLQLSLEPWWGDTVEIQQPPLPSPFPPIYPITHTKPERERDGTMNFLQKGLAGLESRLDKVLLDDSSTNEKQAPRNIMARRSSDIARRSGELPRRSGESQRTSMQERLAAAVGRASPVSSLGRAGSVKKAREDTEREEETVAGSGGVGESLDELPPPAEHAESEDTATVAVTDTAEAKTNGADKAKPPEPEPPGDANGDVDLSREELLVLVSQLREDLAICETRRQEESHEASERIDALGEKLRYLSSESAAAARDRASSAGSAAEKKLAERDEKIALLIEEGERLSLNELRLQTTIKKLRAQAREAVDAKKKQEAAEKSVKEEKEKVRKALEEQKRMGVRIKALEKSEAQMDGLRREKEALESSARELEEKLEEQAKKTVEAEGKVQTEVLETERKTTVELRAQVERVQSEAAMMEEKLKGEIADLQSKAERISEKARAREAGLKAELSVMESKMESLRARVEEASSGSAGDAHAKLLRQVETLQTQYSIASENWQGIEGSLLARVTSLEKERDDLAKKESDVRRKAREMNLKCKSFEADLDAAKSKLKDLESNLASAQELTSTLRTRLAAAESANDSLTAAHRVERATWERELQAKLEAERLKWEETTIPTTLTPAINSSPPPFTPARTAGSTTESYFLGYNSSHRKPSPMVRSPSADPPRSNSGFRTPPVRTDSFSSLGFPYLNTASASRTSLPADDDDYFSPSSPHRHPDLISVSTVAAGPSVQLVERMSASVRRLESEMAGSKEEIARVVAQRDEARAEIVELMREVEKKRSSDGRLKTLEAEVADARLRLETTLEMLGEREERVGELTQDVEDLKEMYRELVLATSGGK